MANKKTIAVVGATGAQGGGLARAILEDAAGGFACRALTRDVNSKGAKELAASGAEVVAMDIDDPESVRKAFEGAYGAFCVTFFWAHFSPEKERAQSESMARAAKAEGLEHVIWSTLEDTRKWVPLEDARMPTLMGKYKVPHFDGKGESDRFFSEEGVPVTFLLTSFYWDNFIHFGLGPQRGTDGRLAITMPMGNARLPGIAAEDIGRCAYGIFKQRDKWVGRTVGIAGGHLTCAEMAAGLSRVAGEEVRYNAIEPEVFRQLGFPGAEDLGNMFQFNRDFQEYFVGARSVEVARSLNPRLKSFDEWLAAEGKRIPIPPAAAGA
jgi:uncharacterized protein YbjT (DUF2867 family)